MSQLGDTLVFIHIYFYFYSLHNHCSAEETEDGDWIYFLHSLSVSSGICNDLLLFSESVCSLRIHFNLQLQDASLLQFQLRDSFISFFTVTSASVPHSSSSSTFHPRTNICSIWLHVLQDKDRERERLLSSHPPPSVSNPFPEIFLIKTSTRQVTFLSYKKVSSE